METVTISVERYNELLYKENRLTMAKLVAADDKNDYGYTSHTSKVLDIILGVVEEK